MSQRLVKLANSLQLKKYRDREKLFVAEGEKLVLDLSESITPRHILCTEEWAENHHWLRTNPMSVPLLKKASSLKNTSPVIGIFEMPTYEDFSTEQLPAIVLDTIQDPGNLGTIIRTAAWFGIRHIICSPQTVDVYNSKVIQATMGALTMTNIHYLELASFFEELNDDTNVYGTFLSGENIYKTTISQNSVIVIGNEGKGISKDIKKYINTPIHIPALGNPHPESLNASVSAAIVCSELARAIQS